MKNFVFAFLILGFSASAHASFQGNWSGNGTATDKSGVAVRCEELSIQLGHDRDSLTVNSGNFRCGSVTRTWPKVQFRIGFNELYFRDKRIGKITPNQVIVTMVYPTNGHHVNINAVERGGVLSYQETWNEPGKAPYLVIRGTFQRR